jgi:hypothetical protein
MAEIGFGGVGALSQTLGDLRSRPFDLFRAPVLEDAAINCRPMIFRPDSLVGDIEFTLPSMFPHWSQLNSMRLYAVARVVRGDRQPWTGNEQVVAPVFLYSSLFSSVEIEIDNKR